MLDRRFGNGTPANNDELNAASEGCMRRRDFIKAIAGSAAAWPLPARAQKVRRIGWLSPGTGPGAYARSFLEGMRERGYVEGQNLVIEYRWAEYKTDRMAELAADLVRAGVELIVTGGSPATLAAKQASATVPIVFGAAGGPVEKGLVASLAHPGGNATGLALLTDDIKTLEILKEMVPGISRVAFIYDPNTLPGAFGQDWMRRARARARTLKLELRPVIVRNPDDIAQAFATLPAGTDALLIQSSSINIGLRARIAALAAQRRLPSGSTERAFADRGCLMSYGEDQVDMFRRAAVYVDKILKGMKPADLPVEQPTRFALVINLKTANALGLELPPLMLARADQVIE
jgi:putative ABC transport system substrate-binding protein